jgi:two-component system sensor histidine kinase CiaH
MFTQARIKLTAFYVLIIIFIISVFSVLLFHYTAQHIHDNIEEDSVPHEIQQKIIKNTVDQLQASLIFTDAIVIVLAGVLSYWLAGRTLDPIQNALHAQEQFSANASHELRTPLAVLRTENEIFLKNKKSSPEDAYLLAQSNLEEIQRMSSMMENLLLLARSKISSSQTEQTQVALSPVLKNIMSKLRAFADSKKILLQNTVAADAHAIGNEKLFEHLFFNIIQNAITYTQQGTVSVDSKKSLVGELVITIRDTGVGISKADLEHIFEPFYKADTSRTISSAGVGLGLSIVQEIVKTSGGAIHIESELNKGTTVSVTLPTQSKKLS